MFHAIRKTGLPHSLSLSVCDRPSAISAYAALCAHNGRCNTRLATAALPLTERVSFVPVSVIQDAYDC